MRQLIPGDLEQQSSSPSFWSCQQKVKSGTRASVADEQFGREARRFNGMLSLFRGRKENQDLELFFDVVEPML